MSAPQDLGLFLYKCSRYGSRVGLRALCATGWFMRRAAGEAGYARPRLSLGPPAHLTIILSGHLPGMQPGPPGYDPETGPRGRRARATVSSPAGSPRRSLPASASPRTRIRGYRKSLTAPPGTSRFQSPPAARRSPTADNAPRDSKNEGPTKIPTNPHTTHATQDLTSTTRKLPQ